MVTSQGIGVLRVEGMVSNHVCGRRPAGRQRFCREAYDGAVNDETARTAGTPYEPFDSSQDGITPASLADVVTAGDQLRRALQAYREALRGCSTPLNLKPQFEATESLDAYLQEAGDELQSARRIIEQDVPLLPRYTADGPKWFGPGKEYPTAPVLSPRQLAYLARLAERDSQQTSVTYREAMAQEPDAVPALIARARDAERASMEASNKAARREN